MQTETQRTATAKKETGLTLNSSWHFRTRKIKMRLELGKLCVSKPYYGLTMLLGGTPVGDWVDQHELGYRKPSPFCNGFFGLLISFYFRLNHG
jgi:hypothetical protein